MEGVREAVREKWSEGEEERREIEEGKIGNDRKRQIERNILYKCVSV